MRATDTGAGVELLEAWLRESAYHQHRHDTYGISLTTAGIQAFAYRGAGLVCGPGDVVVLHPDEVHDGRAGTEQGLGYRIVYVEPALIAEAVQAPRGRPCPLPFVRAPVVRNPRLAAVIASAFHDPGDPLAMDSFVVRLAEGLMEADPGCGTGFLPRRLDLAALERARAFLDAALARVVRSAELETVTGITRYELARQFRVRYGTSPYRYLLMRRLDLARRRIARHRPLAAVALESGFADQSHFTRMFKAAFGLTPARYRRLRATAEKGDSSPPTRTTWMP